VNISRRSLFGKLNTSLFKAVESATAFAKLRGNPYVELVHWLHQLRQLPDSDFSKVINRSGINAAQLDQDFVRYLDRLPSGASGVSDFGYRIELAIEKAWVIASLKFGQSCVRGASLLVAMGSVPELKAALVEISPQFEHIYKTQFQDQIYASAQGSVEDGDHAYDRSGFDAAIPGEASQAISQAAERSVLSKYCSDLTANARDGKIDPVIGRDEEVRTMIDILLRRRQNNPLLTGEAGVGKTAVVEGLALAIAQEKVPPALKHVRLLSLDVGALLAGASMRGEFEARLKSVLQEAAESESPVILFIDEVHTLIGAGGQAGTGDAANLLKPALARGGIRSIGATTWSEFKKHIEKDPALTRRFQVLQITEPEVAKAIAMVRGLAPTFSRHHEVSVMDAAVVAAVTLSHRYIPARQLPDKAISLLDTACARVAMSLHTPSKEIVKLNQEIQDLRNLETTQTTETACDERFIPQLRKTQDAIKGLEETLEKAKRKSEQEDRIVQEILSLRKKLQDHQSSKQSEEELGSFRAELKALEAQLSELQESGATIYPVVNEAVVAAIVSDWTGIPVGRMVKDDVRVVQELEHTLEQRVVGQSQAIRTIAERVKTAKSKLTNPTKPIGTFLLVGPSGVGKTETALALAQAIYGGEHNLITINMSEYQEAHTVSSLKGSPPGYVGYGEGGVLTEAVRRRPYSVVLLDEVEKAHPDVHELFYQVFDKGWMEDGEGRVIDFKNTLILLTSNTGSDLISQLCDDKDLMPSDEVLRDSLSVELRKVFPAAFLGRLAIVPYMPLHESVLMSIAVMQLDQVVARVKEQHGAVLSYSKQVIQHMVDICGKHETGARRIGQFIEQNILAQLAQAWLDSIQNETPYKSLTLQVSQTSTSDSESKNRYQKSGIELVLQDGEPITN
jgi:type VI secretion system protein VasG